MRQTAPKTSLLPVTTVGSYDDFSSMMQFGGVAMETRAGENQWHEREDGVLVSNHLTRYEGQTVVGTLLIDREARRMDYVVRRHDGSTAHISHNHSTQTNDGSGWGRKPGDVADRFDELVRVVTEQLSSRSR